MFIRGSMIRFLIVPDMLKNAPMFKPKSGAKGLAAGAGKSAMMRAQGKEPSMKRSLLYCFLAGGRGRPPRGRAASMMMRGGFR